MNWSKNKQWSLLLPVLLLVTACGEDHALKKEHFYFAPENVGWLPADTLPETFWIRDNNGITYSYTLSTEDHYMNKSWSSVLGINTRMSFNEHHYKEYRSPNGSAFHISLTAGWPPFGDELYVSVMGTSFAWDLGLETLSRVEAGEMYLSRGMTETGYDEHQKILSTVEMLDTLRAGGTVYPDVLHFTLLDLPGGTPNPWRVIQIYLAKEWGLVRYDLACGIRYERTTPNIPSL